MCCLRSFISRSLCMTRNVKGGICSWLTVKGGICSWLTINWFRPFPCSLLLSRLQVSLCCVITFVFCVIKCDNPSFQEQSVCMTRNMKTWFQMFQPSKHIYRKICKFKYIIQLNICIVLRTFIIWHIMCILSSILIIHNSTIYKNAWWVHSFPQPVEFFQFVLCRFLYLQVRGWFN